MELLKYVSKTLIKAGNNKFQDLIKVPRIYLPESPKTCDEIKQQNPNAVSKKYTIDPDGTGPLGNIQVCQRICSLH